MLMRRRAGALGFALLATIAAADAQAADLSACRAGEQALSANDYDGAIGHYDRCLRERGLSAADKAKALNMRGRAYLLKGQHDRAVIDLSASIMTYPTAASPYNDRGTAQLRKKQYALAVADYEKAIAVNPEYGAAYNNLAWLLATCPDAQFRDGARAVTLAEKARQLLPNRPREMDTLAAAYAEAGRFDDAVRMQRQTIDLMLKQSPDEVQDARARLESYEQHKAWRE
jgi:tetratricopeptide (TPR) repeat protein